ncbi:MAG: bifunctional oligoribonuclease/PAP phosphatase NrnA [Candidatus Wallbacteria bacterium]|nr:bifunctional oligoribonuclease/PAP phosphatase NrnA [Candidatus Wallbacteria bacterium]
MINTELRTALAESKRTLIVTHLRPDGDAFGSVVGLLELLTCAYPTMECQALIEGTLWEKLKKTITDRNFHFDPAEISGEFDLMVALDCGNFERLVLPGQATWKRSVNIDHHPTNTGYGDLNIFYPDYSSTAEMIYWLFKDLITARTAYYLLIGICSDTGFFRNDNVGARTLRAVSEILELGADLTAVNRLVECSKTAAHLQLLSLGLSRLKNAGNGIYYLDFPFEEWKKITPHITDIWASGVFYQVKNLEDCEYGIYFMEASPGEVLVEFRTKNADCSLTATKFGGGGHTKASGCSMKTSLVEAVELIVAHVRKSLAESPA